jgi:hypothetical protein
VGRQICHAVSQRSLVGWIFGVQTGRVEIALAEELCDFWGIILVKSLHNWE